jgi:hypothetical protein
VPESLAKRRRVARRKPTTALPARRKGRPPGSGLGLRCAACQHPERGRLDFLIASGQPLKPLSEKFNLSYETTRNHSRNGHISKEYIAAVRASPLASFEQLQKLASENGTSVLENLHAVYCGLQNRWLRSFIAGDDAKLSMLTSQLHKNLELRARISQELLPGGTVVNNFNNTAILIQTAQEVLNALEPYPEAKAAVIERYERKRLLIDHVPA